MTYNSPLLEKSLHFAARIVKLYQYLSNEKKEKEAVANRKILRQSVSYRVSIMLSYI